MSHDLRIPERGACTSRTTQHLTKSKNTRTQTQRNPQRGTALRGTPFWHSFPFHFPTDMRKDKLLLQRNAFGDTSSDILPFTHSSPRTSITLLRCLSSDKSSTHFTTTTTSKKHQRQAFMIGARRARNLQSTSMLSSRQPLEHITNLGTLHLGTNEMPQMVDSLCKCT